MNFEILKDYCTLDDLRDIIEKINEWAQNTDFTYYQEVLTDHKAFFRAFTISYFVDSEEPISSMIELQDAWETEGEVPEHIKTLLLTAWKALDIEESLE